MTAKEPLPVEFLRELDALERAYLTQRDPIRQSGFAGGAARWRDERGPILDGIDTDGTLLDIGCANGFLLQSLVEWGAERGLSLVPYGLDQGATLIELARLRFPSLTDHFWVGNAWSWQPPRRFDYVYTLYDCVPPAFLARYIRQILEGFVRLGGRLIIGAYGSRSRGLAPFDLERFLRAEGYQLRGTSTGGYPVVTTFAWLDATTE